MKKQLTSGMLALALGLTTLTACGDEDNNDNNTAPPTAAEALDSAIDVYVDYQCQTIFQCPEQAGLSLLFFGRFTSVAECKTALKADFGGFDEMKDAIDKGRVAYDAAKAQVCLDKMAQTYKNAICKSDAELDNEPAECEEAFKGAVAIDGKCLGSDECADNLYCNYDAGNCYGVCKADPCVVCGPNQLCDDSSGTAVCSDPLAIDAECTYEDTCVDGATCYYGDNETGKCLANGTLENGESCDEDDQCKGGLCNDDYECATETQTSTPVKSQGEACGALGPLCKPGLTCVDLDFTSGFATGTCGALIAKGGACDLSAQCVYGLYCEGADPGTTKGQCADPKANGSACEDNEECQSGECNDETKKCEGEMVCSI